MELKRKKKYPLVMARLQISERLEAWSEPEINTGCRLWFGVISEKGYGRITVQGKLCRAHRVAYEAANGAVPAGLQVLHSCDTPSCVNPSHLRVGTNRENHAEKAAKGRARKLGQIGEANPLARLTEQQAIEIRQVAGKEEQGVTAARFGIARRTVRNIQAGLRWKHLVLADQSGAQ